MTSAVESDYAIKNRVLPLFTSSPGPHTQEEAGKALMQMEALCSTA